MEEAGNGRDASTKGNANEENGWQEAVHKVNGGGGEKEEEKPDGEGEDGDEEEAAEAARNKWAVEDNDDD